jgi:hypothetical protein
VHRERVLLLRAELSETLRDPLFLDDAKRQGLNVDFVSGQEITGIIPAAYRAPKVIVERIAKALGYRSARTRSK